MCLACAVIEEELAEQEQFDAQAKLRALHEAAILTDTVASDDEQQQ